MRAMLLRQVRQPLEEAVIETPSCGPGQVLLRVDACGVCRTDLHICDGDLPHPKLPLVLGHEIVGTVLAAGAGVASLDLGQRVGVPWLGSTCGECAFCTAGHENLCDRGRFTGYQIDGGYAQQTVADARYCFPIDPTLTPHSTAPLLCAGLIGYRSLRMAGEADRLGLYGFGAAAHIIAQVAVFEGREVYAFTRDGDEEGQEFARNLGATWAGGSTVAPPVPLDAAILFAPVGALVPVALRAVRKGGVVVCAGIHMTPIPSFSYDLLWGERILRSVANLTRQDGEEFLALAASIPIHTVVETYPLAEAQQALNALRDGRVHGAAVLVPSSPSD